MKPHPGEIWQHFKGTRYRVVAVGKHSEDQEEMVAYANAETGEVWMRPLSMWQDLPEVRPSEPGQSNCHHSEYSRVLKEGKSWCQECLHAAKLGRFMPVIPEDIYVILDTTSDRPVARYFSTEEKADQACKKLNAPLRCPCFRVEKRRLE